MAKSTKFISLIHTLRRRRKLHLSRRMRLLGNLAVGAALATSACVPEEDIDTKGLGTLQSPVGVYNGQGWNGQGWNGIGWNGQGWNGQGLTGHGWNGQGWNGVPGQDAAYGFTTLHYWINHTDFDGNGIPDTDHANLCGPPGVYEESYLNDYQEMMIRIQSLAGNIGELKRQTSDVTPRSRQTCDEAAANWIVRDRKDNRDDRCCLLCGDDCSSRGDDDVDLQTDEFGRDLGIALTTSLRPPNLNCSVAPRDPAPFVQPPYKSIETFAAI